MGERSFRASKEGVETLTQAFNRYGQTQDYLGGDLCSRQTVNKFLKGARIDKKYFQSLCGKLGLNWQDIAELESSKDDENTTIVKTEQDSIVRFVVS